MDANTQKIRTHIMSRVSTWIKSLLEQSTAVQTPQAMAQLEQRVRAEGQQLLGSVLEALVQNALGSPGRESPPPPRADGRDATRGCGHTICSAVWETFMCEGPTGIARTVAASMLLRRWRRTVAAARYRSCCACSARLWPALPRPRPRPTSPWAFASVMQRSDDCAAIMAARTYPSRSPWKQAMMSWAVAMGPWFTHVKAAGRSSGPASSATVLTRLAGPIWSQPQRSLLDCGRPPWRLRFPRPGGRFGWLTPPRGLTKGFACSCRWRSGLLI
jgi:hypothetical protein